MDNKRTDRDKSLADLERAVNQAAAYLAEADEALWDGHQTAREVLAHLVFWHREYLTVARALAQEEEPSLKQGTFAELNAAAAREFADVPLDRLARRWLALQVALNAVLRRLPDWQADFPVKHGGRKKAVVKRVAGIQAHIRHHLRRLQRAERLGQDWVSAYYEES
ncbi:MAG: DinB family protein [Candidatus Promineifilaceae bacterium]|nr:DinB family protein [Candidatus Promineifilaceae bacterium]